MKRSRKKTEALLLKDIKGAKNSNERQIAVGNYATFIHARCDVERTRG